MDAPGLADIDARVRKESGSSSSKSSAKEFAARMDREVDCEVRAVDEPREVVDGVFRCERIVKSANRTPVVPQATNQGRSCSRPTRVVKE